jgi:hypothetical protein
MDKPAAAPDDLTASVPRFLVEVIAWMAAPWALWSTSAVLAIAAVAVLIAVPTIVGQPGAKKQRVPIAVPAAVAIGVELIQPVVAVVASAFAWPSWITVIVVVLAVIAGAAQLRRWRWMTS